MKTSEVFPSGSRIRHRSYGEGTVVQDNGGPTLVVKFSTYQPMENSDTLEVSRSLVSLISQPKKTKDLGWREL